jgi:hypothetical protein
MDGVALIAMNCPNCGEVYSVVRLGVEIAAVACKPARYALDFEALSVKFDSLHDRETSTLE